MGKMTSKVIVTTTINSPTIATKKFANKEGWDLIVVGDDKTPHEEYEKLNCFYMHPDYQEKEYKELSDILGWRTIQRRNIGFVEAYRRGYDIIATVDDDNIPYDDWGENVLIGQTVEVDLYEPNSFVFDPLSVTNTPELWHRGYPIEEVPTRHEVVYKGKTKRKVLIQADLWDGDPDIDAMARLSMRPCVKYDVTEPYCSNRISPFNSQNTFLAREVIPYYSVLPFVGRMDDIWGGYIVQAIIGNNLIYNKASVYQDRNEQDLVTNLENEIVGYRDTKNLIENLPYYMDHLPEKTREFIKIYRSMF